MRGDGPRIDEQAFQAWFRSAYGSAFLELEQAQVRAVMPRLFGCRLLQLGIWGWGEELLEAAPLHHHWTVGLRHGPAAPALVEGDAIPVPSLSMDAILAPHSLEFVAEPLPVLREIRRMLADNGQVIILGFNPWSLIGLRRCLPSRRGQFPWCGHPRSPVRLIPALEGLGLEIAHVRRYGLKLPRLSGDPGTDGRRPVRHLCAPVSDGYLVVARKRVLPLTPSARPWRPARPKLEPVGAPRSLSNYGNRQAPGPVGPSRVARGGVEHTEKNWR